MKKNNGIYFAFLVLGLLSCQLSQAMSRIQSSIRCAVRQVATPLSSPMRVRTISTETYTSRKQNKNIPPIARKLIATALKKQKQESLAIPLACGFGLAFCASYCASSLGTYLGTYVVDKIKHPQKTWRNGWGLFS